MDITSVKPLEFLWVLIKNWSIDETVKHLKNKYNNDDFKINFVGLKNIFVFTSKNRVRQLLKSSNNSLSYVNDTFMASHGHQYGIGGLDIQKSGELWNTVHKSLAKSIDQNAMNYMCDLMREYKDLIIKDNCDINYAMSEYVLNIWARFCFGKSVDVNLYRECRNKIINVLGKTFYERKTNYIPYVGYYIAKLRFWYERDEFKNIDKMMRELLNKNTEGFLHNFSSRLDGNEFKNKVILDNTFLSFLVYDFIHTFLLNSVVQIASRQIHGLEERLKLKYEFIEGAFLFPYRMRTITETTNLFKKNDFVICDLTNSKTFFSYGPRRCIGEGLINKMYGTFCDILKNYIIEKIDDNAITKKDVVNFPLITSTHTLKFSDRILFNNFVLNIDHFPHNGIQKFYRIESIFEREDAMRYIKLKIVSEINKLKLTQQIDFVALTEARGFLFSYIADAVNLPIIVIRKTGKIAGETYSVKYKKTGYGEEETLELSKNVKIKDSNIIMIDDGIASGNTSVALSVLLKLAGAKVVGAFFVFRHTYIDCVYDSVPIYTVFTL